jgi:hypothetical protein
MPPGDDFVGHDGLIRGDRDVFDNDLLLATALASIERVGEDRDGPSGLVGETEIFRSNFEAQVGLPRPSIQFQGRVISRQDLR